MSDAYTEPGSPGQRRGSPVPSRGPDIRKVAAALVSAAVVICGLYYGREILIPLAIAFLITFALNPPITWLARRGLPRLLATSLVMVVVDALWLG
jgi:predicted PurR-regulated permease PerM